MHNIDRITNEYEFENAFEFEGEGEGEFEFEFEGEGEGEYEFEGELEGEAYEMEMATQLLGVSNELELEQFLGKMFKNVAKNVSNFAKSSTGKALLGGLKTIAKKALPIAGKALGNFVLPGVGGMIGGKLGSFASNLFELEMEGMSNEDREFEVARRYVRFATDATRKAAAASATGAPASAVVASSLKQAAYNHAPGLLRKRNAGGATTVGLPAPGASSGAWRWQGNNIVVYGA